MKKKYPAGILVADCLIGFGSNQGDSESHYRKAIAKLAALDGVDWLTASSLQKTAAVTPHQIQPSYFNGAIRLSTRQSPSQLFEQLIRIENELGRIRTKRWGARAIDLDLLLFDSVQMESETLQVPHPRMTFRRFVLEPAVKIAGDMLHPVAQCSLEKLLIELNSKPQRLLWATCPSSRIAKIIGMVAGRLNAIAIYAPKQAGPAAWTWQISDWQIAAISRRSEFENERKFAKVVVWGNPRPPELQTAQFKGAQLDLEKACLLGIQDANRSTITGSNDLFDPCEEQIADELSAIILSCRTAGDERA